VSIVELMTSGHFGMPGDEGPHQSGRTFKITRMEVRKYDFFGMPGDEALFVLTSAVDTDIRTC
jgi:hypothetical protein